jgi:raffinose/stachyose/melibiose transport system permease protein
MEAQVSTLRKKYPDWFLLPGLLVFTLLFVTPTLTSFFYSLTNWNINTRQMNFVGLENFRKLFADKALRATIANTLIYAFSVTFLRNAFGLILAIMLNNAIKGRDIFRTVFFLPNVIAPIVIGYLFTAIYNSGHGMLNTALRAVGLGFFAQDWLNNIKWALFSVIMTDVWRTAGFAMVIYLAGLQIIPLELYESADIDGASSVRKFTHISFPLLAPTVTINVVLAIIGTMKVFVMILVLTNGGPGYATDVMNTYIMRQFSLGLFGYGTAANLLLSLFVLAVGLPILLLLRRKEIEL